MKHTQRGYFTPGAGVVTLVSVAAILVAANLLVSRVALRADVTADRLYTLSQGSRDIVRNLDSHVVLKFFFNRSAPEIPVYFKDYARQVEDLLREYEYASGGRLTLEVYDPSPDSDAEEWAQKYGVQGQVVNRTGTALYLGLVAVAGDTEAALPVLDPRAQNLLEYNITRLVYRVVHPEKPRVGVLSSLPVNGAAMPFPMPGQQPQQPWVAFKELGQDYTVENVPTDTTQIPTNLAALVIVHPKELSDGTLYAIDQFILGGGRVLALVDPFSYVDTQNQQASPYGMRQPSSSNLATLFGAWGITYEAGRVLMDARAVSPIGPAEESPVVLTFRKENLDEGDIVTAQLGSLFLPFAGTFSGSAVDGLQVTPLLRSSESSTLVDAMMAQFGSQALRNELKGVGTRQNVAVRITGTFPTAFPEGNPSPATNDTTEAAAQLTEGKSSVILVADADMLFDAFCVEELNFFGFRAHRPLNDNLSFFYNALEQLAGASALIGIRSRGNAERPFHVVDRIEQQARETWQAQETRLTEELRAAEQKLQELQQQKDASQKFILTAEQQETIERFRNQERQVKRELKNVRKNLRREIDTLGAWVKVLNIVLVPLAVAGCGVAYGVARRASR